MNNHPGRTRIKTRTAVGGNEALVIGGSLAGLLAARVLTEHFDRVTIIERDCFPAEPVPRKGVPQSRHVHGLMMRGRMILEDFFPGLQDELIRAGAPLMDSTADLAMLTPAGWATRFASNLSLLTFTRDLLDYHVRRRLAGLPQVRFIEEVEVTGLLPADKAGGVAGAAVRLRSQAGEGSDGAQMLLPADLVIDASGRGSQAPQWLAALGYAPPPETMVNGFLGYASRLYRRPASFSGNWKALFIQAAPPERTRAGLIFPVEGDRWLVSLTGGGRDYPPIDEAGFADFARHLASLEFYNAIKDTEPLSPISSFRATENRLRHYERMPRLPQNFIVLGDAACAFNPVYGQGMSAAALGALALAQNLREQASGHADRRLASSFQKKLAKVNAAPWMLATSEDYRYRETVGGPASLTTRLMHRYMDQVIRLSTKSSIVRRRLMEVFHMLRTPDTLFHPGIILRVLKQAIKQTLAPAARRRRIVSSSTPTTIDAYP